MIGSYAWVKKRAEALHRINFTDIIKYKDLDLENVYENAFEETNENRATRFDVEGFCNICHCEKSYEPLDKDNRSEGYKLTNISHGTHTLDFLTAFGLSDEEISKRIDGSWIDDPVLFLMENPSTGDFYKFASCNDKMKRPANCWYWIHESLKDEFRKGYFEDSTYLVQVQYGKMVAALIYQFKLGNAYLTNIVKCGMTDAVDDQKKETGYKNLDDYSRECKKNCIENIISEEIDALCKCDGQLRSVRIFAFGERTYWMILDFLRNSGKAPQIRYQVYQLPHPASREKNIYRKHILRGILKEAFISDGFKEAGETGKKIRVDEIWKIFNDVYKGIKLGYKVTDNQYALKMNSYKSLFSEEEIVTEVWVKGDVYENSTPQFRWGIGYVFETNSYWCWNYDEDRSLEDERLIPHNDLFKKSISEVLKR